MMRLTDLDGKQNRVARLLMLGGCLFPDRAVARCGGHIDLADQCFYRQQGKSGRDVAGKPR